MKRGQIQYDPAVVLRPIVAMFFRFVDQTEPVGVLATAANSFIALRSLRMVPARKAACRERKITAQAALGEKPWAPRSWEKTAFYPAHGLSSGLLTKAMNALPLPASVGL